MPNVEHWAGKGARRSPFEPPAARGPVVSAGGRLRPPTPLADVRADGRAPHRREPSAACRRRSAAGQPKVPPSLVRGRGPAGHVASGRWWRAVVPVARALTVLPLLLLLRTDCRRAATPAPDSRSSALLTNDRPVAEGSLTAALVEEVAHVAGLTKKRTEAIVETMFRSIAEALHQGEKVELRGFGSFRLRRRGAAQRPQPQDRPPGGRAVEARRLGL